MSASCCGVSNKMFSYFQSPSVTMTTFLQALSLAVDKQFEEKKSLADCV